MGIYNVKVNDSSGNEISLSEYKNKVLIIVNTASKCGLTPQFNELEALYKKYKEQGLEILGFPCNQFANQDPGTMEEIKNVCFINFGVTFRIFEKIEVNGENEHPLYTLLKSEKGGILGDAIKWNFTKFLIDKNGNVVRRYSPTDSPMKMEKEIEKLLK